MFREQYRQLNEQVRPDKSLLQSTIREAKKIEQRSHHTLYAIRKPVVALVSACLCLSLAMPALAAAVEPVYELMYAVSPTIAQFFMPVQRSDEDSGIKMEVVSAYIHGHVAEIYITMQDLTGDRIDATTDLFYSYSINCPFDSSAHCERIGYDDRTKTATFLITIEGAENRDITGDKITFTVKEFLSHKQVYDEIKIPVSLSSVTAAQATQNVSNITGSGKVDCGQFDEEDPAALIPSSPMKEFPVDGIDLTGIGYIEGKLHIQTAVVDNLNKGNYGSFYLKDSTGDQIDCNYSFNFVDHDDRGERIDYYNYVFDIPQSEISKYTLHGDFITSNRMTKGNWRVTFPLSRQSN